MAIFRVTEKSLKYLLNIQFISSLKLHEKRFLYLQQVRSYGTNTRKYPTLYNGFQIDIIL